MSDRDDTNHSKAKDNVDPRLEPKNAKNSDRVPRGSIALPTPPSFGTSSLPAEKRFASVTADYQRQRGTLERNISREHQLGAVMRGERENQQTLSREFDAAKARESKDHFAPAPDEKSKPDRQNDRER